MKIQLHLKLLAWLLLLAGTSSHAQWQNGLWTEKQAYNWHFGVAAGLDFNTTPPTALTDSAIAPDLITPDGPADGWQFIEGTASISDADGNLLFYTNGVTVWNANNEIMENGEGLLGSISSTQSGVIVPAIGNPDLYYIFSVNGAYVPTIVVYSEVDMSLNGGLGAVTENKNIEIATQVEERITAVHHQDGEQIWIVIHNSEDNGFKSFLISEEGINTTPVISNAGGYLMSSGIGAMKASPDGDKIATTRPYFGTFMVEVFDFNNSTGEVSEVLATLNSLNMSGELLGCYGIEFSPNSKFLYAATMFTGRVYQFYVTAGSEPSIEDSGIIIGQSLFDNNFSMQLAPDGKIYLAHGNYL